MTIEVSGTTLRTVADDWDRWGEECGDARRDLRSVSSTGFGPPRTALDAFVDTWEARCDALRGRAQSHADALRETADGFDATDTGSAGAVGSLLPRGEG